MRATVLEQGGCFACRLGLAYGLGDILQRRVELSTPLHSLISIKEALFWKDVGRSPYTGSTFRGPPLLLPIFRWTSAHITWQAAGLSVVDWITAQVLSSVADDLAWHKKNTKDGVLYTASLSRDCVPPGPLSHRLVGCRAQSSAAGSVTAVPGQPMPDAEYCSRISSQCGKHVCVYSTSWGADWQPSHGRLGLGCSFLPVCTSAAAGGEFLPSCHLVGGLTSTLMLSTVWDLDMSEIVYKHHRG